MQQLPNAFAALLNYPQFILYKLKPSTEKPGKMDKLPVAPFDRRHDVTGINPHKPRWWVDAHTAIECAARLPSDYGVAFVLTEADPFFLLDIDSCGTGDGWNDLATDLLNRFAGAGVEVSQSGDGLHILGQCQPFDHGCKNEALKLELYTKLRFVALTGKHAGGDISQDCTAVVQHFAATMMPPPMEFSLDEWTNSPREDWLGYSDDTDLLNRALESNSIASAFGARATFRDLWEANSDVLQATYPDGDREYNASQADGALAQHLAFWTGCDCERIERLMRMSALVRDKWDDHKSYMHRTIIKAISQQKDVHKLKQLEPEAVQPSATIAGNAPAPVPMQEPTHQPPLQVAPYQEPQHSNKAEMVSGYQYLPADMQLRHFAGCVYVQESHSVLTPDGGLLAPDKFRATYGGYLFALDANNDKQTKSAWEAFVESQAIRHPKVHKAWFKPDQPFGQIELHDGWRWVNTFKRIETPCVPGDVTPFMTHLQKILPDPNDQAIILSYMAAIIQFPGAKFQWAPLIQGAEGNGKTLLSRVVEFAIGERYSHMPPAKEISEKFNSWLFKNLFIGVEDIYVPEEKRELIEVLKPMITNERLAERAMQSDQVMKPVCANFIFNSNHMDAVRKTHNDRRFAVFYCAQQTLDDIERSGMGGAYFPRLYDWLRNGGYAAIHHMLVTYAIPAELNPAVTRGGLAQRAPRTSSTDAAVQQSMGRIEQEVLEAIDEGRPGFAGGWVSSTALDRLLDERRASERMPRNKRRDMMQQMGYEYHPLFDHSGGRVTINTTTDGNKPRLFLKRDHPAMQMSNKKDVVQAYDRAQSTAAPQDENVAQPFGRPAQS